MKIAKQARYHATMRYQTFEQRVARICGIARLPTAPAKIDWIGATWTFSDGEISDFRYMPPMLAGESSYLDAPSVTD